MKKKPLYNAQMNIQEEERKEALQRRMEDKKYNTSYLEELRSKLFFGINSNTKQEQMKSKMNPQEI